MPKASGISCPACGFTLKAGSKTCDFCGYEFEDTDASTLQSSRQTVRDSPLTQLSGVKPQGADSARKAAVVTRKVQKQAPPPRQAAVRTDESRKTGGGAVAAQEDVIAKQSTHHEDGIAGGNPQSRIKELEKQLTDAEKELDEISKLLGPGRSAASAAASTAAMTANSVARPPPVEVVSSKLRTAPPPVPSPSTSMAAYESNIGAKGATGKGLSLRFRGVSAGAIVVGLVVYALSFLLSPNIGRFEMYLLMLPASILVAVGIYASLEAKPSAQRL